MAGVLPTLKPLHRSAWKKETFSRSLQRVLNKDPSSEKVQYRPALLINGTTVNETELLVYRPTMAWDFFFLPEAALAHQLFFFFFLQSAKYK